MNYIIWKVTDEDFEKIATFADEKTAKDCADFMQCASLRGIRYEVTKANETPVW